MVAGDDPGLLSPLSQPAGMVLTLGWFLVLAGWAAWRSWTRDTTWKGSGGADLALLGLFAVLLISTFASAEYKQPAWLISWEWLSYGLAFFLVRQLARAPEDNHALLCALAACAASIAAQALYQRAFELPELGDKLQENSAALKRSWPRQYSHVENDDAVSEIRTEAIQQQRAAGTFVDPENLAAFLALLAPTMVGLTIAAAWDRMTRLRAIAIGACVLLALAGVVVAGSWSSLATLAGAAAVVALALPLRVPYRLAIAAAALALGAIVILGFPVRQQLQQSATLWEGNWRLTGQHAWTGVGAGNLGRQLAGSATEVTYREFPGNLVLELFSSGGPVAVGCLIGALALAGRKIHQGWHAPPSQPDTLPTSRIERWEFLLGGMAGLLLGFVLRTPNLSADQIQHEGWMCGLRAVVWLIAFALLYTTGCTLRLLNICCLVGGCVMLVHLCFAGSMSNPSLGLPFWVMAAVALNTLPAPRPDRRWGGLLGTHLLVPLTLVLGLVYVMFVFAPVTRSALLVAQARQHYEAWDKEVEPSMRESFREGASASSRQAAVSRGTEYLERHILEPLRSAGRANPGDAYLSAELAFWMGRQWDLASHPQQTPESETVFKQALDATGSPLGSDNKKDGAQSIDPRGMEGYFAEFNLHAHRAVAHEIRAQQAIEEAKARREKADKAKEEAWKTQYLKDAAMLDDQSQLEAKQARLEKTHARAALDRLLENHPREREKVRESEEKLQKEIENARKPRTK